MTRAPVVGIVGHRYAVPRPHVVLDVTGTPRAYADRVATAREHQRVDQVEQVDRPARWQDHGPAPGGRDPVGVRAGCPGDVEHDVRPGHGVTVADDADDRRPGHATARIAVMPSATPVTYVPRAPMSRTGPWDARVFEVSIPKAWR